MLASAFAALSQELVSWHVPQAGRYLVGMIYATAVAERYSQLEMWASDSEDIVLVDADGVVDDRIRIRPQGKAAVDVFSKDASFERDAKIYYVY